MVTISVGVALTTDFPQQDLDEIIHAADVALYAAKAAGRNCVRVAQSLPVDGGKGNIQPESPVLTP
jgi:PleD family two-component response regulator